MSPEATPASAGSDAGAAASQSAPQQSFGLDIVSALFDEPAESLKPEPAAPASKPAPEAPAGVSASAKPVALKPADEATPAPSDAAKSAAPAGEPEPAKEDGASRAERSRQERERLQAENERLDAAVAKAIAERDDAAAALRTRQEAETAANARYASVLGSDEDVARLQRLNNTWDPYGAEPDPLTPDERADFRRWTAARELREPFIQDGLSQGQRMAQEILGARQVQWVEGYQAVAAEVGFDPATAPRDADPAGLIRHAVTSAVAPLNERISQLEAEVISANDRAAGAGKPVPSLGGRSGVTVPDDRWDPSQSVEKNLNGALWGSG